MGARGLLTAARACGEELCVLTPCTLLCVPLLGLLVQANLLRSRVHRLVTRPIGSSGTGSLAWNNVSEMARVAKPCDEPFAAAFRAPLEACLDLNDLFALLVSKNGPHSEKTAYLLKCWSVMMGLGSHCEQEDVEDVKEGLTTTV